MPGKQATHPWIAVTTSSVRTTGTSTENETGETWVLNDVPPMKVLPSSKSRGRFFEQAGLEKSSMLTPEPPNGPTGTKARPLIVVVVALGTTETISGVWPPIT